MKIAVEGCCHGELDKIYETLAFLEKAHNTKVDILLMCGDFQAVRNRSDLQALAVPPKYQKMNTFYKYYSGEKKAPVLTIFVGGNHEASNYLQELPYGGWVAPNIYYLGYASVVQFGGVRIGGVSGIFKGRDHNMGHFEHPPYNDNTKRSCYHVRNLEIFRLKQVKQPIDIFLSHDWPRGITDYGDVQGLLRRKRFLRDDIENNLLGSPVSMEVLHALKPDYWFAAHLHCKFASLVKHDMVGAEKTTKFLSLDKCLPKRDFLQIVDIPHDPAKPLQLELDPEWLCILKSTNHLLNLCKTNSYMPGPGSNERWDYSVSPEDLANLNEDFGGLMKIPDNFERTAPTYSTQSTPQRGPAPAPQICINPQTTLLCEMLGITDPFAVFSGKQTHTNFAHTANVPDEGHDSPDIDDEGIPDDSYSFVDTTMDMTVNTTASSAYEMTNNPDEISLDDGDEDVGDTPELSDVHRLSNPEELSFGENIEDVMSSTANQSIEGVFESANEIMDASMGSLSPSSSSSPHKRGCDLEESVSGDASGLGESSGTESSQAGPNMRKKFKRRNQSLYSNN